MIDPTDAIAAVTHADPYPYYARLVRERPAARDPRTGVWIFASAAAVATALTNPACRVRPTNEPIPPSLAGSRVGDVYARMIRMRDDPSRAAVRATLHSALAALDERAITTAARQAIALIRESAEARGALAVLVDDCAARLPALVVAILLGVHVHEASAVAAAVTSFVRAAAPDSTIAERTRGDQAVASLLATLRRSIAGNAHAPLRESRDATRDDVATLLANAAGLLFQAHDATAGLIGGAALALARDPALEHAVRARHVPPRALLLEVARHDAPVQNTRRFVAADALVFGQPLRAGDTVLVVLGAANRDPSVNSEPDRFHPARPSARCFTFGVGAHACLARELALGIAAAAVRHVLDQCPDLGALLPVGTAPSYRASTNARIPRFAAPLAASGFAS